MSKEMNKTNSKEEMKNLSENAMELKDEALDNVSGGARLVPDYTDEIIRCGNRQGGLAPKKKA